MSKTKRVEVYKVLKLRPDGSLCSPVMYKKFSHIEGTNPFILNFIPLILNFIPNKPTKAVQGTKIFCCEDLESALEFNKFIDMNGSVIYKAIATNPIKANCYLGFSSINNKLALKHFWRLVSSYGNAWDKHDLEDYMSQTYNLPHLEIHSKDSSLPNNNFLASSQLTITERVV